MYPSTITSFAYPQAADRLNNPSHSALENLQSSTIGQIEAVIGLSGDGPGTIIGDLRSSSSDGGGHIQAANKGGTGQTSYNKGDILVATSSSVLSKLAVSSTTGEILTVDTSQPAGVKWGNGGTKLAISNNVVSIDKWQGSIANVLFSASVLGSTLGTSNGLRFTGVLPKFNSDTGVTFGLTVNIGVNSIATQTITNNGTSIISRGVIEGMIVNNNAVTSQLGYIKFYAGNGNYGDITDTAPAIALAYAFGYGTSSVNSSTNQDLVITGQFSDNSSKNSILTGLFVVEKIS